MPMSRENDFLIIKNASKHFGAVKAVDDVSITISQGEFFSLLGPSGCGKTTLLRMLAGFEAPTTGEIFIDGVAMSAVAPHHRPTNMVFQSYAIFPHLNVAANVAYGLRRLKLPKVRVSQMVEEALAMVKLSGFGERRSHELSGGQRQRVALARALILRPKVLLLDEPLGALDKKLREEMQLELRALQKSVGITFIFVTHDQEEALTLSDRVAVMSAGRCEQIAGPKELYERPATVGVADFIGQMNFFKGLVQGVSGTYAKVDTIGLGEISAPHEEGFVRTDAEVAVAIRPEKLHLSRDRPGDEKNSVPGTIRAAAYLGDRSHYYVNVDGCDRPVAVASQNVESALTEDAYSEGGVWLSWSDKAVVLLPPASQSDAGGTAL